MLYNKNWDKPEIKADPFSLAGLIAWLEKQPAAGKYPFYNCQGRCLLGQYMASIGEAWNKPAYESIAHKINPDVPHGHFPIGSETPHTFGAALERARFYAASPQETRHE